MFKRPVFSPAVRQRMAAAFLALGAACAGAAHAATPTTTDNVSQLPGGPSLQFVGSETGSWESNPLMLQTGEKPLWGSVTAPELIFNGMTPLSTLNVDALVDENLFNQTDFDSTDLHGKVNFNEKMQNWGLQIQQQTDYDTTRTSELSPVGINNFISNVPVRHLGLDFAPTVSYTPTPTDKVSLTGSIQDSQYDNPIFANYLMSSVAPSYTHDFDPLNSGLFTLQAQQYQTTSGPSVTVNSVGPMIGWIGKLTPRFTAQVSAGVQGSDQYGGGVLQSSPWTLQYIYAADLAFKGEQDTTHFTATRADYPFGNGTESLLSSYALTENHALNPRFSLNFGASYQSADYLTSSPGDLQALMTGTGGLTFHATERLDITASYQFRYETLVSTNASARDNLGTLSLVYRPQAWGL
jgi:hypothetical protein